MEPVWIIFFIGTTLSFLLFMFLHTIWSGRSATRKHRKSGRFLGSNAKRQFLDCLRHEALRRVDRTLLDAKFRNQSQRAELGSSLSRIDEIRAMINLLFSHEAAAKLEKAVAAVEGTPNGEIGAEETVRDLHQRLRYELVSDRGAPGQSLSERF